MQRVIILGNGGSGKSVLAREVSRRTGLPVVHLDPIFWRPDWKAAPREDARAVLNRALAADRWIVDGNWVSAGDVRFERADTAIFLDLPRTTCIARAARRSVRDRHSRRPDLPEGCREGLDWGFLKWMWNFDRDDRPQILARLHASPARLVHLRSPAEVQDYASTL